jgi:hypothetical protein
VTGSGQESGQDTGVQGPAKERAPRIVVSAPDGTGKGEHALTGDRLTVGRSVPGHTPDVILGPDPQSWISRLHCWLERVAGSWYLVDNGSVNGTMLERQGNREAVAGRVRLQDKDEILILGYLVDDEPFWWRLKVDDPFTTVDARPGGAQPEAAAHVEYSLAEARLVVVAGTERTEIRRLGRNQHKLVRYMASRNTANGGASVTCTHEELIAAVWGEPETWPHRTARTAENLRDLVFELRKKLAPHEVVETVPGLGYSLRTAPPV